MSGRNNIYETENGKSVNRRDSGFTLIEVVVAMLVLTIGLLGTANLAIYVMKEQIQQSDLDGDRRGPGQDGRTQGLGYDNLPASLGDIDTNSLLSYSWDVETVTTRYDADGDV